MDCSKLQKFLSFVIISFMFAVAIDVIATLYGIEHGYLREINPLFSVAIEKYGYWAYFGSCISRWSLALLALCNISRLSRSWFSIYGLYFVTSLHIAVVGWHVALWFLAQRSN